MMLSETKRRYALRRTKDAVMVPDRGFTKQLKALDPEYEVVWDYGKMKWEIWKVPREGGKKPYHVLTVETKGKSYRELGTDVLLKLQYNQWFSQNFTAKQIADYFDEMDRQIQRRKAQDFRNKIQGIALDTFSYAQGILQVQVPRSFRVARAISGRV